MPPTPPGSGALGGTRRRVLAGVAAGAVVALLATLLAVLWPGGAQSDDRERREAAARAAAEAAEDVTAASVNLAASGAVVYEGSYLGSLGGSHTRMQVTSGGTVLSEATLGGMTVRTLAVDGKTFVKADSSFWQGNGRSSDKYTSRYKNRWVKSPALGGYDTGASLRSLTPGTVAGELQREAGKRLVSRGGLSTVGGVKVRRYTTPTRTLYITAQPPLRIVRMAPAQAARPSSGVPSLPTGVPSLPTGYPSLPSEMPSLPSDLSSLFSDLPSVPPVSPAGYRPAAAARARSATGDAGASYTLDLPPLDDTQRRSLQGEVEKAVKELEKSVDLGVSFSVSGNVTLSPCSTSGCVANATITNSVIAGDDTRPSGPVSAQVTISVTLDGRPVGQCSQSVSMPPNGSASVSCPGNFYIPPSRNPRTHLVRAEAQAVARAMVHKEVERVLKKVTQDWKRHSPDYGVPGLSSPFKGSTDQPNKFAYRNPALARVNEPEPSAADLEAAQEVKNPDSGTRDHMYQRWSKYVAKQDAADKPVQPWPTWRNNYVQNQGNPYKGEAFEGEFAQVNALEAGDGWRYGDSAQQLTSREMMNKITGVDRMPDIVNFDKKVMYEMKYGSSKVKADQVAKDKQLIGQGWRVVYVFSKRPSRATRLMLDEADIPWKVWKAVGTAVP
ncbi:hypothetical protein ABT301_36910 [Streptomyces sp. NPDC000987]|uniref:hypothetical protein n=1 Tax=Streptomyces sp. NPDC000987 TaxID=3154374 RepID=UPI00332AB679